MFFFLSTKDSRKYYDLPHWRDVIRIDYGSGPGGGYIRPGEELRSIGLKYEDVQGLPDGFHLWPPVAPDRWGKNPKFESIRERVTCEFTRYFHKARPVRWEDECDKDRFLADAKTSYVYQSESWIPGGRGKKARLAEVAAIVDEIISDDLAELIDSIEVTPEDERYRPRIIPGGILVEADSGPDSFEEYNRRRLAKLAAKYPKPDPSGPNPFFIYGKTDDFWSIPAALMIESGRLVIKTAWIPKSLVEAGVGLPPVELDGPYGPPDDDVGAAVTDVVGHLVRGPPALAVSRRLLLNLVVG